jgi:hypothetical protein
MAKYPTQAQILSCDVHELDRFAQEFDIQKWDELSDDIIRLALITRIKYIRMVNRIVLELYRNEDDNP